MGAAEATLVFVAGVLAGTINTVVGSGTLVTFPTLLFFGYAVWGTTAAISARQETMERQLLQEWQASTDPTVSPSAAPSSASSCRLRSRPPA